MKQIEEAYCSFETAKLLKEKGFDENCAALYDLRNGEFQEKQTGYVFNNSQWDYFITATTLQMAMKWLREMHSLYIWIGHAADKGLSWYYEIHGISDGKVKHIGGIQCGSYEVACEAAIKYCLEHLI